MKIVVFGNSCGYGGAQTAFRRLIDFLASEGHALGIIGLVGHQDRLPERSDTGFSVRLDDSTSQIRKFHQLLCAVQRARRFAPVLFVGVGLAKSANFIGRCLSRNTFRLAQDFIFGRNLNDPLLAWLKHFNALAVQAPSMVEALRMQGFNSMPLSWLPCFPDAPHFGFTRIERNGRTGVRLGYFGRLAPNKGIDLLLRGMASAQLTSPVELHIWGNGSEMAPLQKLTSVLKLSNCVSFCGSYPEGEDCAQLMCSYDGLVLPSTGIEGLPLILLEAMAYGIPFLTTRVGAIPDAAGGNEDAVLVEPNVESLRAGLETFVHRSITNAFSVARAQEHYLKHFSYDVMADRWRRMMANPKQFFAHDN